MSASVLLNLLNELREKRLNARLGRAPYCFFVVVLFLQRVKYIKIYMSMNARFYLYDIHYENMSV